MKYETTGNHYMQKCLCDLLYSCRMANEVSNIKISLNLGLSSFPPHPHNST